jgi:hypothetical protein
MFGNWIIPTRKSATETRERLTRKSTTPTETPAKTSKILGKYTLLIRPESRSTNLILSCTVEEKNIQIGAAVKTTHVYETAVWLLAKNPLNTAENATSTSSGRSTAQVTPKSA